MKRVRVATYDSSGPFAGRVVSRRAVEGNQKWLVMVALTYEDGSAGTHAIEPKQRVPLIGLLDVVMASIKELTSETQKITRARMDFLIEARA